MYAVSKTALLGLTRGLAEELGPQGVRVNCVAPGIVPTKFSAALVETPELVSGRGGEGRGGEEEGAGGGAGAASFTCMHACAYKQPRTSHHTLNFQLHIHVHRGIRRVCACMRTQTKVHVPTPRRYL